MVVLAASSSEKDEAVGVDVMRLDEEDAGEAEKYSGLS